MESSAHYLLENLETQLSLHNRLLTLLKKKQRALIERDAGGLEEICSVEEGVVAKIRRLTTVRASILEKLSVRYAVPRERRNLSGIGDLFPEDLSSSLKTASFSLAQTALKIVQLDTVRMRRTNQPGQDLDTLMGVLVGESVSFPVKIKEKTGSKL